MTASPDSSLAPAGLLLLLAAGDADVAVLVPDPSCRRPPYLQQQEVDDSVTRWMTPGEQCVLS
jgi:hypothetical protein